MISDAKPSGAALAISVSIPQSSTTLARYSGPLVHIASDTHDGLRREEWSFRADGAVHSYAQARRDAASDEWTYTLLTFPDFPPIFGPMGWKDPPQEVKDRAAIECAKLGASS